MISIIIPVFNTGESCRRLLVKLFGDKYRDIEVICIDDASTDGSYDYLCKSFPQEKRLTLLRQKKNAGAAAARNRGLRRAKGDYVIFLDSDDMVQAGFLTKLCKAMNNNTALALCGIRQKYLASGKTVDKFITPPIKRRVNESTKHYALRSMAREAHLYSSVNKIYRGEVIRKARLRFREDLDFAEDTTFVLDYLAACAETAEIHHVPEALYVYNYGTETSVVSESALNWKNWERNFRDIEKWAAADSAADLKKLYRRFKISHALAVARSQKSREEKLQYLSRPALLAATLFVKLGN